MSKILPFKKKTQKVRPPTKGPTISMKGCHFEKNGIGMLLGEGVEVDMKTTKFTDNGIGIVAGELDEQFLQILKSATAAERFKYAQEVGDIAKCENSEKRSKLIANSSIGQKLANIANVATASTWLTNVIDGASKIDLDKLIQTIMG
ncbi:hypothetical protein [Idiomarina sp.]|uniref:hypothetical protein n=1 Tax=Idiomarina sp. TaxID=1874361 RepID=UPI003A946D8A